MPKTEKEKWTTARVADLYERLGCGYRDFGEALWSYEGKTAYDAAYALVKGDRKPSAAVERTLSRLDAGEITPVNE
ncbi:MAG: hypothetical protein BRD47_02890 [Bacteroidetes bacterium QS_8_68_28]|nr:MAG: hypothetical protein BRD47_02890 [Bacteroidetes bacterium QS_8_68_28]